MLQTKNNWPDLVLADPAHRAAMLLCAVPCTILNVILLKSIILALVNKEYRNSLAAEAPSWKVDPKVAITLRRATELDTNNLRKIEKAAFRRYRLNINRSNSRKTSVVTLNNRQSVALSRGETEIRVISRVEKLFENLEEDKTLAQSK